MTDHDSDPLDPLDELASATLDGVADVHADDPALDADTSQALADRVARLSGVRDRLAAPVAPPADDVRDRMIAQAVSAGAVASDQSIAEETTTGGTEVSAPVSSLDQHRSRRTTRIRQFAPLAAAAVVLLLIAIVTPALIDAGGDDLASSFTEPSSDAVGGEMADTGGDAATAPMNEQALPRDAGGTAEAMAEESADDAESGAVLVVPSPLPVESEPGEGTSFDEAERDVSDEELLDAVIRYRAAQDVDDTLRSAGEEGACAPVVPHPIDLALVGSYQTQPAVFLVQTDGSAVLAVTVVSSACEVLAQVIVD